MSRSLNASINDASRLQHLVNLINNLHLDTPITQVTTCVQRIQGLLQRKCVADKLLKIEDASSEAL